MKTVNIKDVQANLQALVEEAAQGDPFMIEMAGTVLVKVLPADEQIPTMPRRLGFMTGEFKIPDDFDTLAQDEIESMFRGDK